MLLFHQTLLRLNFHRGPIASTSVTPDITSVDLQLCFYFINRAFGLIHVRLQRVNPLLEGRLPEEESRTR